MAVEVVVRLGKPQPKQREFFLARRKFVAFGGARGQFVSVPTVTPIDQAKPSNVGSLAGITCTGRLPFRSPFGK